MKVKVTKDFVTITEKDIVNRGEVKAHKCFFEFEEEFEFLTKKAIFSSYEVKKEIPILNNECFIPSEVLKYNSVELRVYGYSIENEELILRYSPKYDTFPVELGSYIPGVSASEEITPTQFEQYSEALNQGLNEVSNVDIDAIRESEKAVISITNRNGKTKNVEVYDGDSGMVWFNIDDNGYLVGYSEHQNNLDKYYIDDNGYFCIDLPLERGA